MACQWSNITLLVVRLPLGSFSGKCGKSQVVCSPYSPSCCRCEMQADPGIEVFSFKGTNPALPWGMQGFRLIVWARMELPSPSRQWGQGIQTTMSLGHVQNCFSFGLKSYHGSLIIRLFTKQTSNTRNPNFLDERCVKIIGSQFYLLHVILRWCA